MEVYSRISTILLDDPVNREQLFYLMEHSPTVMAKGEWCLSYICDPSLAFGVRILAGAIAQSIFTSSSFAYIYWFQFSGLMPGLCQANDRICRDGRMHMEFACLLWDRLLNKPSAKAVRDMICEAVALEKQFVSGALVTSICYSFF